MSHTGFAAPAEEELADTITIGQYLIHHKESTYLLRVESDAMEDAGIFSGDMILFERRTDAKKNDIVVVLTEDGYVLKYVRNVREGNVIGVVTASFRTYV